MSAGLLVPGVEPYFADGLVTLYCGRADQVLAGMPDGSVDCIVTSPPYYGLRDYQIEGQIGIEPTPAGYGRPAKPDDKTTPGTASSGPQ